MPSRLDLGLNAGMAMPGDTLANGPTIHSPVITGVPILATPTIYGYSFVLPSLTVQRDQLTAFPTSGLILGYIDFDANSSNGNSSPFLNTMYAGARLAVYADEAWTAAHGGTRFELSTTVNGGQVRATKWILDNAGKLWGGATTGAALWSIDQAGAFVGVSFSGTSAKATILATARNIDGQAFDGSGAITVIAPGTHAATTKATPVDADELPLVDSAASNVLKKLTWANLKATLKTYFDGLYQPIETTIANHFADASLISNTSEQDMWSDSIPLATLVTNGDRIVADYTIDLAGNTHTKLVGIDVAGSRVGNYSTATAQATALRITVEVVRVNNGAVRCGVTWVALNNVAPPVQTAYLAISSINLTTTAYNLKVVAQNATNASTTDIIGRMGKVRYQPA